MKVVSNYVILTGKEVCPVKYFDSPEETVKYWNEHQQDLDNCVFFTDYDTLFQCYFDGDLHVVAEWWTVPLKDNQILVFIQYEDCGDGIDGCFDYIIYNNDFGMCVYYEDIPQLQSIVLDGFMPVYKHALKRFSPEERKKRYEEQKVVVSEPPAVPYPSWI